MKHEKKAWEALLVKISKILNFLQGKGWLRNSSDVYKFTMIQYRTLIRPNINQYWKSRTCSMFWFRILFHIPEFCTRWTALARQMSSYSPCERVFICQMNLKGNKIPNIREHFIERFGMRAPCRYTMHARRGYLPPPPSFHHNLHHHQHHNHP